MSGIESPQDGVAAVPPRGRLALSPTGKVHLGNARTALLAWLSVRSRGGVLVWRLEDLDPPRVVPGLAREAERDLTWLGLDWDEGGAKGGAFAPYEQSARYDRYECALRRLADAQRVFPCSKSRRDLLEIATAPHGLASSAPYPVQLRPERPAAGWLDAILTHRNTRDAVRFITRDEQTLFDDRVHGPCRQNVAHDVGDFVLRRRDGLWAYQLAVVVDDIEMRIDEVVRGDDLLDSTARQIQLIEALGAVPPQYAHVPLVTNGSGNKLSKRDDGLTLEAVRAAGATPEQVTGYLAWSVGLVEVPKPVRAADLIPTFDWGRIGGEDFAIKQDVACEIARLA